MIRRAPEETRGQEGSWSWGPARILVRGPRRALDHFTREFGPPGMHGETDPDVVVDFRRSRGRLGRHKGTFWRVALSAPSERPIRLAVEVHGPFGLPLIQSILIEPLFGFATGRAGVAAVPGAAVKRADGAVVAVLGRSGSGKTSLALEALGLGRTLLADDRLLVHADGKVGGGPRRLRLYHDQLARHAALAERLDRRLRRQVALRRAVSTVSRGFVRLPVLVDAGALGSVDRTALARPAVVALLHRGIAGSGLVGTPSDRADLETIARELLADDRIHLARAGGRSWAALLDADADRQSALLAERWHDIPILTIAISRTGDVRTASRELAMHLDIR